MDIYREKLAQAAALLGSQGIDIWLLFVRETSTQKDPSLPLICDLDFTWETAVLVSADGRHAVVAGLHDCDNIRTGGIFEQVVPYTEGISAPLRQLLAERDPKRIGVNYSTSDPAADGLTHGMWLTLNGILAETAHAGRLESAAEFVSTLRATKTDGELSLMRAALRDAEEIFTLTGSFLKAGQTEREIADFMHAETDRRGLGTSWERSICPIVNAGPGSASGHSRPGDIRVAPGNLVHIDFGVSKDGYCTDQQRVWYCRRPGETEAPPEVLRGFEAVRAAIQTSATALRPGLRGWEIDAIARRSITEAGYPEYQHALGHTVGRTTHDGGTLLGPRWERYGTTPEGIVAAGQVYTLELEVETPSGVCGLEEEVLVTEAGCEFLSPPQTELAYI